MTDYRWAVRGLWLLTSDAISGIYTVISPSEWAGDRISDGGQYCSPLHSNFLSYGLSKGLPRVSYVNNIYSVPNKCDGHPAPLYDIYAEGTERAATLKRLITQYPDCKIPGYKYSLLDQLEYEQAKMTTFVFPYPPYALCDGVYYNIGDTIEEPPGTSVTIFADIKCTGTTALEAKARLIVAWDGYIQGSSEWKWYFLDETKTNRSCTITIPTTEKELSFQVESEFYSHDTRCCITLKPAVSPSLTISPTYHNSPSSGDNFTISVSSNTTWSVSNGLTWLVYGPASGTGNGVVTIYVDPNTATTSRTGYIHITGGGITRTCTITQAAAAPTTCTQLIKVFDEDGEIIENALIRAESATHTASCRTGANGEACSITLNSGDIYVADALEYTTLTPAYFTACSGTEEVITARRDYCIQKFNVSNQFGEPIEGAEVECKSLWHFNPKATTNSDGLCGINIKKGINWKAVATKSGCEPLVSEQDFTSCTSTITLTLTEQPPEPKDTILKCYDKTTEATTPIQLEAKITTTLPYYDLNNCNITFFIDDINIGSSTSDAQGKALLSYTPSTTGTYTIKALFSGAGEYAASECISTLIVREKYIPIIPEGSTHILEFELKSLSWANIEGLRETLPQITSWMASAITLKGAYGWEALGSDIIQKDNKYFLTIYLKETGTPPILLAGAAFITFVAAHLYFFGFLFIASLSSVLLYKIIGVVGDQVEVEKIDAMTEASIIEARLGMCDEIEDPEEKAKCLEELAAEVEEEEAEKTIIETLISTLMDALNITESQAKLIVYGGGGLMALSFILPLFRR